MPIVDGLHLPFSEQSSTITSDAVKFVASLLFRDTCHTFKLAVTLAFTSLKDHQHHDLLPTQEAFSFSS